MTHEHSGGVALKDRFGTIAEILPVIIWSARADGTVDFVSEDFYQLTGLGDLDLDADAWLQALHPDDRDPTMVTWRSMVENGQPYRAELRIRAESGEYRWHVVEARCQRDGHGQILRWFGTACDIQDRKLVEAEVESERRLSRLLLDCAGEGVHGIDRDGKVIFENAAALQMLGYEKENLLGQPAHQTIHHRTADGDHYPVQDCPIYQSLKDGRRRYVSDEVFVRCDGSSFPVAYTAAPTIEPHSGEITGAVVNFRDITQSIRDRQLTELESKVLDWVSAGRSLQQILDGISDSIEHLMPGALASILLVEDGKLRHASAPSLAESYNDALDGMAIGARAGSCGTAAYTGEAVIVHKIDEDPRWQDFKSLAMEHDLAACWSVPVFDANNKVLATVAVYYRDEREPEEGDLGTVERIARYVGLAIERGREAELLRVSERRFRLLSQATSDVVWDWDFDSDEIWWNEGIEERFGYPRGESPADAESWKRMIHPDDRERVLASIKSTIESGGTQWQEEYRVVCADGSERLVENRGYLIKGKADKPIRMVGSIVDVSQMRQLEGQLAQTQRLEAVGQLTGGVAHDFNNLLTVIIGNAELLLGELRDNVSSRSMVEMIYSAATRGSELISRLLSFARRQMLDPKPIDVNRLVSDIEQMLRRTLSEDIELQIVCAGGLWPAMVDAAQLESALLNLCLNARDAMPNGGQLTIETVNVKLDDDYAAQASDVSPGHYVMLAVSDTGVGMDPETLDQAFEPFFSTKHPSKGSGLGLSMVYGFAKQTKGHVRIYSERNEGTTVKLYLPRARESRVGSPIQLEARSRIIGGTETILAVEDNDLVRRHVETVLTSLGYEVLSASSGQEALSILEQNEGIDLLFTDVVMPGGLSGRDLADRVRKQRPELPVLFTSGYTENAIVHGGRLKEGVHLLQKPYRREELAAKIRKSLAKTESS